MRMGPNMGVQAPLVFLPSAVSFCNHSGMKAIVVSLLMLLHVSTQL